MRDPLETRLGGFAVYNPDLLSKRELIEQFTARHKLLERFLAALRTLDAQQHHLIIGERGMGKTTFLRRLKYAVEDDRELSSSCIALCFPEEQYNVARLSDFYAN